MEQVVTMVHLTVYHKNQGIIVICANFDSCTATPVGSRPSTKASTKSTKSESRPDSVAPEEVEYMIDRRDEY